MSFLSDHSCTLLFTGGPHSPAPLCVRVPQGSPISPLLFVIYVAPLHQNPHQGIMLSYMDDISIMVASDSYSENAHLLSSEYDLMVSCGSHRSVTFLIPKTEAIHWHSKRDHSPPDLRLVIVGGTPLPPLKGLRWIGFWLFTDLSSYTYHNKRNASAQAAFTIFRSFSSAGKCLTPANNRRFAVMAVLPMPTYGASILPPSSKSMAIL